jgi:hypothetical protein
VIFDRSRYYWIALALAVVIGAGVYFSMPRVTPQQRVREQVALLATEPWIRVRVDDVRYVGAGEPEAALLRGVRLDTGAPVAVDYTVSSPYTASGAMRQLLEKALPGTVAEVLMIPRALAREPYRSELQSGATHVGVTLFAGLPQELEPVAESAASEAEATESGAQRVAPAPGSVAPEATTPPDTAGEATPDAGAEPQPSTPPEAGSAAEPSGAPGAAARNG